MSHHPDDLLLPFATDDLDATARQAVARHLETCPDCRAAVAELRETHARLAAMAKITAPDGLASSVLAAAVPLRSWPGLLARAAAALVLVAIGAGGMWWWTQPEPADGGDRYALVFYERLDLRGRASAAERTARYRRFGEWLRPMAERGLVIDAVKLADEAGRAYDSPASVRVRDGQTPAELALSGLVIVRARTYDEVAAFVVGSPIFDDGGRVEIRKLFGEPAVSSLASSAAPERPTSVGTSVDAFMIAMYPMLRRSTIAAVEKMPAGAMSLKPSDGARTFAETAVHAGVSNLAMCRNAVGASVPPDELAALREYSTKPQLLKLLNDAFTACDPIFATPGDERAATRRAALSVHAWGVYGSLAVYLRMNGIVPPTTEEAQKAREGGPGRR